MGRTGNIVLIGMPGVGKSTVGVVLAKLMNKQFIDTDLLIQAACGATLDAVIAAEGPERFIKIEDAVLRKVDAHNAVIATGGSAVYSEEGMRHLSQNATVVYLSVGLEELRERLGDLRGRGVIARNTPSDKNAPALDALFDERRGLYERYANITFDTQGLSLRKTAEALATLLAE